jgi:hypothetical protein
VQSCKDSERGRRLRGLHGETSYVLLRDRFSNTQYGAVRLSGLHGETSYVLLRYRFSSTLYGAVSLSGLHGETSYVLLRDRFSSTLYGAVRRLSGLHGETCYVLLGDRFGNTLYGANLCSKAPPIEWHLQLSQLKWIHAPQALTLILNLTRTEGARHRSINLVMKG